MIKSFTCTNFRNVNVKELEFAKVNLLIGPNNAGKSNLIRALSFAANMLSNANKDTSGFFAEVQRNGSADILRRNSASPSVSLGWRIALEGQDVDYTLVFHPGKGEEDSYIIKEAVDSVQKREVNKKAFNFFLFHDKNPGYGMFSTAYQFGQKNHRVHVPAEQSETALLQFEKLVMQNPDLSSKDYVSKTMFSMLEDMRSYFLKFYAYTSSKFDFEKIRQLQDPGASGRFLTKDGSNLVNVYRYACKKDPDFRLRFLNKMKSMMRDLKKIEVEEGLDKIGMRLYFNKSGYMLSEVSDGTIEALLLALLTSIGSLAAGH